MSAVFYGFFVQMNILKELFTPSTEGPSRPPASWEKYPREEDEGHWIRQGRRPLFLELMADHRR